MDSSRLKRFVVPLVVACLIPVAYRTGKSLMNAEDKSVLKVVSKLEKRLDKLEKEGRESSQQAKETDSGLNKLEKKIENMEAFMATEKSESIKNLNAQPEREENNFEAINNKYDGSDWIALTVLSTIQVGLATVVLVLFVKVKNLKALLEEKQTSPRDSSDNNCSNSKTERT